jgi:hypothetical protein
MLTGTTLGEFFDYCGHDGSEDVQPTKKRPFGKRCFSTRELYGYLLAHDMMLGWGITPGKDFDPKTQTLNVDLEPLPALLDVASTSPGVIHCVLWNGQRVIDPWFPEKKRIVDDYIVLGWWPVTKMMPDDLMPLQKKP